MSIGECFENVNMPPCVWFEGGSRRNSYAAMLSGLLVSTPNDNMSKHYTIVFQFFAGWWAIIDASSVHNGILAGYHMCGVVGTISLIMINSVSNAQVKLCNI